MGDYSDYGSGKHDSAFKEAGIQWYPWVGKRYDDTGETGIMIVGDHVYGDEGVDPDWHETINDPDCHDVNRYLAMGHGVNEEEKPCGHPKRKERTAAPPYYRTTQMLLEGAEKKYDDTETRKFLWESVAFANFCQCPTASRKENCHCPDKSQKDWENILGILKPKLCIVWSVELWRLGLEQQDCGDTIGKVQPRIAKAPHGGLVAGILHPSGYEHFYKFDPSEWMKHLRDKTPEEYQVAVRDFLDRLKNK